MAKENGRSSSSEKFFEDEDYDRENEAEEYDSDCVDISSMLDGPSLIDVARAATRDRVVDDAASSNLASHVGPVSLDSLMRSFGSGSHHSKLLRKREKDAATVPIAPHVKLSEERDLAYSKTAEDLEKWKPVVLAIKNADSVDLCADHKPPENTSLSMAAAKETKQHYQIEIEQVLKTLPLVSEGAANSADEIVLEHQIDDQMKLLRQSRALLFYKELKSKRAAKIKSKTYRRHKRLAEGDGNNAPKNEEEVKQENYIQIAIQKEKIHAKQAESNCRDHVLKMAFASDSCMNDEIIMGSTETSNYPGETLPGWGHWSNVSCTRARETQKKISRKRDTKPNITDKKFSKYLAKMLPHPYQNVDQYNLAQDMPLGKEWNSIGMHSKVLKPGISVRAGQVIAPIKYRSQ